MRPPRLTRPADDETGDWVIYLPPKEIGGPIRMGRFRRSKSNPGLVPTFRLDRAARFPRPQDARHWLRRYDLVGYRPLIVNIETLEIHIPEDRRRKAR